MIDYIKAWNMSVQDSAAIDWLIYLGLRSRIAQEINAIPFTTNDYKHLWNYRGAIYMAEMLPEHFSVWRIRMRIGVRSE